MFKVLRLGVCYVQNYMIMTETRITKIEEGLQTFDFVSRCGDQLHLHFVWEGLGRRSTAGLPCI